MMSKLKFMIKTLWLYNHTKTLCKTQIPHLKQGKCVMNKYFETHFQPLKHWNRA